MKIACLLEAKHFQLYFKFLKRAVQFLISHKRCLYLTIFHEHATVYFKEQVQCSWPQETNQVLSRDLARSRKGWDGSTGSQLGDSLDFSDSTYYILPPSVAEMQAFWERHVEWTGNERWNVRRLKIMEENLKLNAEFQQRANQCLCPWSEILLRRQ